MVDNWGYYQMLESQGIAQLASPYSLAVLKRWNQYLDPLFEAQSHQNRAYVKLDELQKIGIFDEFFDIPMRNFIRLVMPDAVLYHFHAYEIAAQCDRPHINAHELSGWHRDSDALGFLEPRNPHYLSIFVYLSDVLNIESGPFEFLPRDPTLGFKRGLPSVKVMGPIGTTFIFNRAYYHRATPNRSSTRRRLLKISIQRRILPNLALDRDEFRCTRELVASGDAFLTELLSQPDPSIQLNPELLAVKNNSLTQAEWPFVRKTKQILKPLKQWISPLNIF